MVFEHSFIRFGKTFAFCALTMLLTPSLVTSQTLKDRIGFTELQQQEGSGLATGTSVDAFLVEPGGNYLPNVQAGTLAGKTINNVSNVSNGTSGHSTSSAVRLFGGTGVSPGVNNVDVYQADDWLNNVIGVVSTSDPSPQGYDVGSHSYIIPQGGVASDPNEEIQGQFTETAITNLLTRLDHVIARDNTLNFVGTNNGRTNSIPHGLTPSYNSVAVGRSDGSHGAGPTTFYGPGRTKVDIVVPQGSSSAATPVAASAGALLIDSAGGDSDAARNQVLKATLLAGATKDEFSTWDRTETRPLDERYGAGELNIFNSFNIQQGGQFESAQDIVGPLIGNNGWDYQDSASPLNDQFYSFEIGANETLEELSAVLAWNLNVTDTGATSSVFTPVTTLANFDLALLDSDGDIIDQSISSVDNIEHIYTQGLQSGRYSLRVSGDSNDAFGLAFRFSTVTSPTAVPEPSSLTLLVACFGAAIVRRRR